LNIAVVVYGSPTASRAHTNAQRFVAAAVTAGHRVVRVFFYHEAVTVASGLVVTPQDEDDVGRVWADLAATHGIELNVCIAAALRRGVLDRNEAERYERSGPSLRAPFELVGLGQLAAAVIDADRTVTFP
jgi:tRNA 2-thiouridine synthesizing protein D